MGSESKGRAPPGRIGRRWTIVDGRGAGAAGAARRAAARGAAWSDSRMGAGVRTSSAVMPRWNDPVIAAGRRGARPPSARALASRLRRLRSRSRAARSSCDSCPGGSAAAARVRSRSRAARSRGVGAPGGSGASIAAASVRSRIRAARASGVSAPGASSSGAGAGAGARRVAGRRLARRFASASARSAFVVAVCATSRSWCTSICMRRLSRSALAASAARAVTFARARASSRRVTACAPSKSR